MSDSGTDCRSPDVEQLVELVARATALRNELATIKAQTPIALFALKFRDSRFEGVRAQTSRSERSPLAPSGTSLSIADADRVARLLSDLGLAVAALEGEREAIERESPLGLLVRKTLGKMPPAGALPVFSSRRLPRLRAQVPPLGRATVKAGRLVLRTYRRLRAPVVDCPRITIVTPVLNGAEHVGQAISSVLAQNYPNLQYIVADGGSTDGTQAVVGSFGSKLELLSEPDRGMYEAIANAFARADGEVLGYLNSDDQLEPLALERVGRYFATHRRVDVIYHENIVEDNGWRFPNVSQPPRIGVEQFLRGHILFQDGVFFRRRAYLAVGGIDPALRLAGDTLLWARLARKFAFVRRPGHVSTFRVRSGQLSSRMDRYNAEREPALATFRESIWPPERLRLLCADLLAQRLNRLWRHENERLFFPLDTNELPPPAAVAPPAPAENPPVCPLSGNVPDRLLFSSPDTRLGYDPLSYVYYVPQSHLAIAYPVFDEDLLTERGERASVRPERTVSPAPGTSPYRNYAAKRFLPRFVASRPFPVGRGHAAGKSAADRSYDELMLGLRVAGMRRRRAASFLSVGCRNTGFLDRLRATTPWTISAIESDRRACERARAAGHDVRCAGVASAGSMFPLDQLFDVVRIEEIERYNDPVAAVIAVRTLMAVGAYLIITTPNLDSAQIDIFGPTWSGWRPPYHRCVFSVAALRLLAERTSMEFVGFRTASDPSITAISLQQHQLGLGAVVPDESAIPPAMQFRARSICAWSQRLFDARGKGDRIVAVLRKNG